tara:strand:- start:1002 stop:1934 length:933 start_codon:yes stop_codon:yes gene_type:complete
MRRKATLDDKVILILILAVVSISLFVPFGYYTLIPLVLVLLHQLLLRAIFRGPTKRSLPFSDTNWDVIKANNNGADVYGFLRFHEEVSDLVVFIHGWQSSSEKFIERIKIFDEKGMHTLAIDMRGHGMAPSTNEWTAGKVIQDVVTLLGQIDSSRVKKVHFYGHSLGGFICLGMNKDRHQGWWKEKYGTLMLESPMVAFSPIMEEMSSRLSFMSPLIRRWAVKGFNKIHPEVGGLTWTDIDIPSWGLPTCPTLLLQAANDSRLGRYHYDLLMKQDLDIHPHLIDSLTHSKNRINEERDAIIRDWIEKMIL